MEKNEYKQLLIDKGIILNPIIDTNEKINPSCIEELPMRCWTLINKSGLGLVYAYVTLEGAYVEFRRNYSSDYNFYTNKEFNDWRIKINTD